MNTIRWVCKKCGGYQKKELRISHDFCSQVCYLASLHKKCKFCKNDFIAKRGTTRYCNNCDKLHRSKDFYAKQTEKIRCKKCKYIFYGRRNQVVCKECKIDKKEYFIHSYIEVNRAVVCLKCGKYSEELIKLSFKTRAIRFKKVCDCCRFKKRFRHYSASEEIFLRYEKRIKKRWKKLEKEKNIKNCDKRFKGKIQEREQRKQRKQTKSWFLTQEQKRNVSERMKKNNPMFDENVRNAVSETLKRNYRNGKIKKRFGKDNVNWRGYRNLNLDVRQRLYTRWIKLVMERDLFSCTKCGKQGLLHVHHIKPLRSIIKEVLEKYDKKETDYDRNSLEYQQLLEDIVHYHKLSDGITLCKECHEIVDYRFRLKNKTKGNRNESSKSLS